MENKMKTVVISGATGMTGSELAYQLVDLGYKVIGFDNFFASNAQSIERLKDKEHFFFYKLDINSKRDMNFLESSVKDIAGSSQLSFIHCAAVVHTKWFYSPSSTFETNIVSTGSFLDLAIRLKSDIFINCSTSEVYSHKSFVSGGVKENDILQLEHVEHSLRTSYAVGKLMTEFLVKEKVDEGLIAGCSIRFANVYSDFELYKDHIIPHIITSLRKSNKVVLLENAKDTYRTFLHNYDSCNAIISFLKTGNGLDGTSYNVGTKEEIAILDLVARIAKLMNKNDYKVEFLGKRTSDPKRRLLNSEKIEMTTGWQPLIQLEEGLTRAVNG